MVPIGPGSSAGGSSGGGCSAGGSSGVWSTVSLHPVPSRNRRAASTWTGLVRSLTDRRAGWEVPSGYAKPPTTALCDPCGRLYQ